MSVILQRQPRTRQPQAPTHAASWLPAGSLIYAPPVGIALPGGKLSGVETVTVDRASGPGGISSVGTATSSRAVLGTLARARTSVGLTLVAQFISSTTSTRYVAGTVSTGTAYIDDFAVNHNASDANSAGRTMIQFRNQAGGTSSRFGSTNSILAQNTLHTVVWEFKGSSARLWLDGVEQAVSTGLSAFADDTDALMEFPQVALNRNLRNSFSNGGTGLNLLLYGRLFGSGYDCAGLSRNPWQLFAPLPRRIWAPAAAGATTHATTGALAGSGAATAGTAARTRAHPTSGVLAGAGAVTAGDAARVGGATTHDTSGALAGAGAAVAGTAAHIAIHATSGALAGAGGAIAGTAARVAAAVTHDTSGALSGGGAIIVGIARGPQPDAVVSGGGGWAYAPMPRRKTKKELRDERIALGILPPDVIAELPAPVVKKARKVGTIKVEDLFGKAEVTAMSTIDLEIAVQRIKRRKRQRQEEELLLM